MATTPSASQTATVTESQSVLLKAFIDQVTAYKYNNPAKKVKGIQLSYDASSGVFSVTVDEEPNQSTTSPT